MGRTLGLTFNPQIIASGKVFHYSGYEITIQSVGVDAGPIFGGLHTDEGAILPLGTIYTITSGPGSGEVWQTTGPNTAVQIVTQSSAPPPSSSSNEGGGAGDGGSGNAAPAPSWFSESTNVFGTQVPNVALLGIGGILLLGMMKKR